MSCYENSENTGALKTKYTVNNKEAAMSGKTSNSIAVETMTFTVHVQPGTNLRYRDRTLLLDWEEMDVDLRYRARTSSLKYDRAHQVRGPVL